MVRLDEFIGETINQIIRGVKLTEECASSSGALVNPADIVTGGSGSQRTLFHKGMLVQSVEFDVAITAQEGTKTAGGVGVMLGPVALGSKGASDAANTSSHRIRFCVPVLLPTQGEPRKSRVEVGYDPPQIPEW